MTGTRFPVRHFFEGLLGPGLMPYLLHLRPLEWPIMTAHFLLGTLLVWGWHLRAGATGLGWLVYVALLNGGTLAINSAFDKDEGDIGYLKQPPKPPEHLLAFSIVLLVASTLLADPAVRQELLSELRITRRLEKLLAGLKAQLS